MKNLLLAITLFILVLSSSCTENQADPLVDEIVISGDDSYSFRYTEELGLITFTVEDLVNTSNDIEADFPQLDHLKLWVDMNNSNESEGGIDKVYSVSSEGAPCMSPIIHDGSTIQGCTDELDYDYKVSFEVSDLSSTEHIVYRLTVRKEILLTYAETIGFILGLHGDDSGENVPNSPGPLYNQTIEFTF